MMDRRIPPPKHRVAAASIATAMGQPGGHVLTPADVPAMVRGGWPIDVIVALDLATREECERIQHEFAERPRLRDRIFKLIR